MNDQQPGLVRPDVSAAEAVVIARSRFGIEVTATELGSNQDRNFLLEQADGVRHVLRIDNPVFSDDEREAQHAALEAYRNAGVPVPHAVPGLDGALTQRTEQGFAARLSSFVEGEPMLECGYLAPTVIERFGKLVASSVNALANLSHAGLDREHMWTMDVAHEQTQKLTGSISDPVLRVRVTAASEEAYAALSEVSASLPTQAIHGDLTDDNVMGRREPDGRLHPHTILDLGDIAYGWRISELAVTLSSLLHHEQRRPLRVLDAIVAYSRDVEITPSEARALWPLVVLRASVLVASGWHQLRIDGDNEYAQDRIAVEQAIFEAATHYSLAEMTEQVLAALGLQATLSGPDLSQQSALESTSTEQLRSLLPELSGSVRFVDPGVESAALDAGKWKSNAMEGRLVDRVLLRSAAAVLPYGVFRLTRTTIDNIDAAATWPLDTEIWLRGGDDMVVASPLDATVQSIDSESITLKLADGWLLVIAGIVPSASAGAHIRAGDRIGVVAAAEAKRLLGVGLRSEDAPELPERQRVHLVTPERVPAWQRFTHDPAAILAIDSYAQRDESRDELARREQIFASAQERYYERPMQIERGWKHHLIDTTGRAYVDMVNNVTGLGHGHPGVADAVNQQIRVLNTNSRFLYRELAEYSERLLALLPEGSGLDTVLLVNSGSEAVDLALRLAQAATGRKTVVALREAYHGWTMASDAVTTSAYDNPYALENRPDWVHVADVPNRFRGTYRGEAHDATVGERYADDLAADIAALAEADNPIAGFICESVLGNAGGVLLPEGYLDAAYRLVREAGGLCIADEVQVGFGRMGSSFWGFEQSGVMPDIITIAKPMGNGFPIGGVITSKRVADALATQGQFFASAGGNPLSCRVGIAVLDAMKEEGLQENARVVGAALMQGFAELASRHNIVGPIHGEGLYLGVELVKDRETMEPATAEAAAICERLKELGVIVLTTSERSNVLKVKPPLCLTIESAEFVVAQLDRVLSEGW